MSEPLGDVALGEVRRWANTCEDVGGRLYALPLVDAYEELRTKFASACDLLARAQAHLDRAGTTRLGESYIDKGLPRLIAERDALHAEVAEIRRARNNAVDYWQQWQAEAERLREAGNDLLDALLTAGPSSMYARIVHDAMLAWQGAIDGDGSHEKS